MKKSLLVAGLVAPLLLLAADRLNVKTGLWEIITATEMHGLPPIPPEALAKMTPDQRAQMTALLKKRQGEGPRVDKSQECITEEDLDEPFRGRKDCQSKVVKSSATLQDIEIVCGGEHPGKGLLHIEMPTPDSMKGTLEITAGSGAQTMTIKSQLTGRWLGADCKAQADTDDQDTEEESKPNKGPKNK